MSLALDVLSWLCLLGGAALGLISGIGLLRMPDFFTRLHAAGITDTLCATLVLLGLALQALEISLLVVAKLAMMLLFMLMTSPTATHALVKAALHGKLKPLLFDAPGKDRHQHRDQNEGEQG